jgi:zinc protease
VPAYDSADYPALELLSVILGQGESSRLNRSLVRESKLAAAAPVLLNPFGPRRGPGELIAFAITNQGVAIDSLEHALAAQLGRVASEGVSEAELTKAKNSYRAGVITGRQTPLAVAEALQTASLFLGSPDAVAADFQRHMAVTAADIRRVAGAYLRPDNSLTLLVSAEAAK